MDITQQVHDFYSIMWYLENTYTVELQEPEGEWQAWLYLNTTSLAGVDLVGPCPCPCLHCHYSNSWVSPSEIEKKGIYEDVQYLTFLRTYLEEIYSPVKHLLYNMLFLFSTHFFNFSVISRKMYPAFVANWIATARIRELGDLEKKKVTKPGENILLNPRLPVT